MSDIIKRVFEYKASLKGTPDRLKGWTVSFAIPSMDASLESVASWLMSVADENERAVVAFILDAVATAQDKALKSYVDSKAREEGKTYTRDEVTALPQRSAVVSKEDLQTWANGWGLEAPKVKPEAKAAQAEAKARRLEEEKDAATRELLAMLADLPKAKRQDKLDKWIADGIVPEGTTLPE